MRPRDNIEKIIKKFNIDINTRKDQEIFDELRQAQAKSKQSEPSISTIGIWRRIAEIKKAKFIAAAMIVIVMGIGFAVLNSSFDRTKQGSLKQIEKYAVNEKSSMKMTNTSSKAAEELLPTMIACDDFDDSNYGISVEGLTREEACQEILAQFWQAMMIDDLKRIRQLFPTAMDWDDETLRNKLGLIDEEKLTQLLKIGQPYDDETFGSGLVIVPNFYRCIAGREQEIRMIIRFCQTDDRVFCVIQGSYGCSARDKVFCCESTI